MPDYNLTHLATRSFEHLVRAIAIRAIGPGVSVFGDGPDGGREAVWEGKVPFPTEAERWDGYGVIQAKFLTEPRNAGYDGDWAVAQLRDELNGWLSHPARRRPEYFVFATNVTLTPVDQTGSRDRAVAVLKEFAPALGIRDFRIWDYDQICTFIDAYQDIHNRYAGWVTPGDVLSRVIAALPVSPDFEDVMASFLQAELLRDQYANLDQVRSSAEEPVPLARVFVDLPVRSARRGSAAPAADDSEPEHRIVELLVDLARETFQPSDGRAENPERALRDGRIVVIGGPGQGKTTLGQFLCQLFRAALLRTRDPERTWVELAQCLQAVEADSAAEGLALPLARRFPFRIVLSHFAASLASGEATSVFGYMASRIARQTDREVRVDDLREWIATYPWLMVLDGLDEVPASSNRADVMAVVSHFMSECANLGADVLVVATTRPQGYNDEFAPAIYRHLHLSPLSPSEATHYAERLVRVRYGSDIDRQRQILATLNDASQDETLARLMVTPLQVTIMATIVAQGGRPPRQRWSLFREYYEVIYRRESERDIPAAPVLREQRQNIDELHKRVGLLLQIESERGGGTEAQLPAGRFAELVAERLTEEGYEGEEFQHLTSEIIAAATDRLVFLVARQEGQVSFELRSFQEFMAAEALVSGADDDIRSRIRKIATLASWRNVLLFGAGKCFAERQHLRETLFAICSEINESPDPVQALTLAGSELALAILEDGLTESQPRYSQMFARLALRLLDAPSEGIGTRLGRAWLSTVAAVYREEIEARLRLGGPESRTAWITLASVLRVDHQAADLTSWWPTDEVGLSALAPVSPWLADTPLADRVPELVAHGDRRSWHADLDELSVNDDTPGWLLALRARVDAQTSSELAEEFSVPGVDAPTRDDEFDSSEPFRLTLHPVDSWAALTALAEAPAGSGYLATYSAAAIFAADPTPNGLAAALDSVPLRELPRGSGRLLPWPIGACIAAAPDARSRIELAQRVREGSLGARDDWLAAEQRWRSVGVTLADIAAASREAPFGTDIASVGFPIAASGWRITHNRLVFPMQPRLSLLSTTSRTA